MTIKDLLKLRELLSNDSISNQRLTTNDNFKKLKTAIEAIIDSLDINAGPDVDVDTVTASTITGNTLRNTNISFNVNSSGEIDAYSLTSEFVNTNRVQLNEDPSTDAWQAGEIRWSGTDFLGWNGTEWLTLSGGGSTVVVDGPLIIDVVYTIVAYATGDDFTNIGAPSNTTGVSFVATGETPAVWTNGTVLSSETPSNTVANVGSSGYGVYKQTTGSTYEFKKIFAGDHITIDSTTDPNLLIINAQALVGDSGYSGYSGFSGRSGYSGFSGISGYSGFSGISGFSGAVGSQGTSGYSGISGYSGKSGFSGFSGKSGFSGFSGKSGFSGASGISGYSGYSGSAGVDGGTGPIGPDGASGFSGFSGYSGYSGLDGASGYSGFSGISGYSGASIEGVGTRNIIEEDETITVPANYQYLIYGDLTIYGTFINEGEVVLINGSVILEDDGVFDNTNGTLTLKAIQIGYEPLTKYSETFSIASAPGTYVVEHLLATEDIVWKITEGGVSVNAQVTIIDSNSVEVYSTAVLTDARINIIGL